MGEVVLLLGTDLHQIGVAGQKYGFAENLASPGFLTRCIESARYLKVHTGCMRLDIWMKSIFMICYKTDRGFNTMANEALALTVSIYYADTSVLKMIGTDFTFIEGIGWYELYQHKQSHSFWRLDVWDKFQEQFFVKLPTVDNWSDYDSRELQIELLVKTRGLTTMPCIWRGCGKPTLQGLAFCERHAYIEMGIRK